MAQSTPRSSGGSYETSKYTTKLCYFLLFQKIDGGNTFVKLHGHEQSLRRALQRVCFYNPRAELPLRIPCVVLSVDMSLFNVQMHAVDQAHSCCKAQVSISAAGLFRSSG